MKEKKFLNRNDLKQIKRAIKYVLPYKVRIILVLLCILILIGIDIINPLIWGRLLKELFNKNYNQILLIAGMIFIISLLQAALTFLQESLLNYLNSNIMYDLRKETFNKIVNLPTIAFDNMRVGDFMSRLNNDVGIIANFISAHIVTVIVNILRVLIISVTIFSINAWLGLILIVAFPISCFIYTKFGEIIRFQTNKLKEIYDNYFSIVQQSITGIREVISLGVKDAQLSVYDGVSKKLKEKEIHIALLTNTSGTITNMIKVIINIIATLVGGYLIYIGSLGIEYFIAFNSYSNQFLNSLMSITKLNSTLQQMMVSIERIFGLIDNLSYPVQEFGSKESINIMGKVKFHNVSFGYNKKEKVLEDVSFIIPENKKVAIIGASGSGKTTIIDFYDFYNLHTLCTAFSDKWFSC